MFPQVLRRYQCLWHMQMLPSKRPQLFVVNLQWTPKDELATLKINGNIISDICATCD